MAMWEDAYVEEQEVHFLNVLIINPMIPKRGVQIDDYSMQLASSIKSPFGITACRCHDVP